MGKQRSSLLSLLQDVHPDADLTICMDISSNPGPENRTETFLDRNCANNTLAILQPIIRYVTKVVYFAVYTQEGSCGISKPSLHLTIKFKVRLNNQDFFALEENKPAVSNDGI